MGGTMATAAATATSGPLLALRRAWVTLPPIEASVARIKTVQKNRPATVSSVRVRWAGAESPAVAVCVVTVIHRGGLLWGFQDHLR